MFTPQQLHQACLKIPAWKPFLRETPHGHAIKLIDETDSVWIWDSSRSDVTNGQFLMKLLGVLPRPIEIGIGDKYVNAVTVVSVGSETTFGNVLIGAFIGYADKL